MENKDGTRERTKANSLARGASRVFFREVRKYTRVSHKNSSRAGVSDKKRRFSRPRMFVRFPLRKAEGRNVGEVVIDRRWQSLGRRKGWKRESGAPAGGSERASSS